MILRYKKKIWRKIVLVGILLLLIGAIIPLNACSSEVFNSSQKDNLDDGFKTLYLKANCSRIYLYKPWYYPVHFGPFWITTEDAFLCLFVEKDLVLKIDGVSQDVELPAVLYPWRFVGLGPLYMIKCIRDPTDGDITLIGVCQDVIIEPYS